MIGSKAFNTGKAAGSKYMRGQRGRLTVESYMQAGYRLAVEKYSRCASRDRFLLGWWYMGYPHFSMMTASSRKQEQVAGRHG